MNQRFRVFFVLLAVFLLGYLLNEFVVSSFFVNILEQNRISIYFVSDCILVILAVTFFALLIFNSVKKDKAVKYDFFLYIIVFISVFKLILIDNYPNVSRQEIGYFYKIPEGQTITYPKYPRGIESDN